MFKLADEVKKKKKKKKNNTKVGREGRRECECRGSEGWGRRKGEGEREEERGRREGGGERRREGGRRVIPNHSQSSHFCLSHPIPSLTIPVWAKMLFKFCQHGPSVFLLRKYRVF